MSGFILKHQILDYSDSPVNVEQSGGFPSGSISTIIFNGVDETVVIDGSVAYINGIAPPPQLNGSNLSDNITLYNGRLSQSNINYKISDPAGDGVNYITMSQTFTLTSIEAGLGDIGLLTLTIDGEAAAIIDLGENFVEGDRAAGQTITNYDTDYLGYPLNNGICNFVGTYTGKGSLEVLSVQPYDPTAIFYQVFTVKVNITSALKQGYSGVQLIHSVGGSTTVYDYFLDTDPGANPSVVGADMVLNNPSTQWLSGIQFYDKDASFFVSVSGIDYCVNNVYRNNWIVNFAGMSSATMPSIDYNHQNMIGFSSPPDIGENACHIDNLVFEINTDKYEHDARITAWIDDPYGNTDSAQSPSYMYTIYSYDVRSTRLAEYFEDENWRHPSTNGTVWPGINTGQWNSAMNLLTGNDGGLGYQGLEIKAANRDLRYPETDATPYNPANTADYSATAGDCYYYRWFYSTASNYNSVSIEIPNGTQYEIMLRLPTQTEWSDINSAYLGGSLDTYGKGCQIGKVGDEYQLTFGGANTGDSGNGFWLRIKDNGTAATSIPYMIITNWS